MKSQKASSNKLTELNIDELNAKYEPLSVEDRIRQLYKDFLHEDILLTSSFAANSAFFLHLFSTVTNSRQTVHFIDTTYHFPETLIYKKHLTEKYKLNVIDIKPQEKDNRFTLENKTWEKDPDYCCAVNKVNPLMELKEKYKVWASGLMRSQNDYRKNLRIFEMRSGILRFYPIVDITPEQRDGYILWHKLDFHPLVAEGYQSIGCSHCTKKGEGREGRWVGLAKTECGLHI
jgi:phosphoadenosine phosphosulfate reductase